MDAKKIIIACENCEAKFYVDEKDIPVEGRFVRCKLCEHEWMAKLSDENVIVQQNEIEKIFQQASKTLKSRRNSLWAITLGIFFTLSVLLALLYYGKLDFLKEILNIEQKETDAPIIIKNIDYKIEDHKSLKHIRLSILIQNLSKDIEKLEKINIFSLDENKKQISKFSLNSQVSIQPYKTFELIIKVPYKSLPQYINVLLNSKKRSYYNSGLLGHTIKIQ